MIFIQDFYYKFTVFKIQYNNMETISIPNIENYTQSIVDGTLVLTPKTVLIKSSTMLKTDLTYSKILSCSVKDNSGNKLSTSTQFNKIVTDIWKGMELQEVFQNTTYTLSLSENDMHTRGFTYVRDLKIYKQGKDANGAMKEIINMISYKNFSINFTIKLQSGKVVCMSA